MRADFQEYYTLDIDAFGLDGDEPEGLARAAALAAQLRDDSRCRCSMNPDSKWDDSTRILHKLEHDVRLFAYGFSKDAAAKRNEPKPLPTPGEVKETTERMERSEDNRSKILSMLE